MVHKDEDLAERHEVIDERCYFTYYFDMVVFHTDEGLVAAYRDDITNTIKI